MIDWYVCVCVSAVFIVNYSTVTTQTECVIQKRGERRGTRKFCGILQFSECNKMSKHTAILVHRRVLCVYEMRSALMLAARVAPFEMSKLFSVGFFSHHVLVLFRIQFVYF